MYRLSISVFVFNLWPILKVEVIHNLTVNILEMVTDRKNIITAIKWKDWFIYIWTWPILFIMIKGLGVPLDKPMAACANGPHLSPGRLWHILEMYFLGLHVWCGWFIASSRVLAPSTGSFSAHTFGFYRVITVSRLWMYICRHRPGKAI